MAREKKTETELLNLIKAALKGYRECAAVQIQVTRGDPGKGETWSVSIAQSGRRVSPCYDRIVEISRGLAAKYDLAD